MLWMLPSQLTDGIACMGGGGRGREGGGKGGAFGAKKEQRETQKQVVQGLAVRLIKCPSLTPLGLAVRLIPLLSPSPVLGVGIS